MQAITGSLFVNTTHQYPMRQVPLFDTNIFSDIRQGKIPTSDWQRLLDHRPRTGWRLSAITLLELLVGVHRVAPEKFDQSKKQLLLARKLSKGRVLDEPRVLLCKNVLHTDFPQEPISKSTLTRLMEIACCANSKTEILEGRVQYRPSVYRGKGPMGINTGVIDELVAGPKEMWVRQIENLLRQIDPDWRSHSTETGLRLPEEVTRKLESPELWKQLRLKFSESVLEWLGPHQVATTPLEFAQKIDAVLQFTLWVLHESLVRKYAYDKHDSDVYDQFQLHYLADERYVFVSNDKKLRNRTADSSQASRILSFDQFMRRL